MQHEFSTLQGVREDVTDIILNLKNLVAILHGESPEIEVRLSKKGPGVVKASDLEAPAELEILNPDLEIANLADRGSARPDADDRPGRGYVPSENNRGPEHTIGVIPIDSIFAGPPRLVRRRGRPCRSAHRLRQAPPGRHDRRLAQPEGRDRSGCRDPDPAARDLHRPRADRRLRRAGLRRTASAPSRPSRTGWRTSRSRSLELGVRSYNCLKRVGIETIGDLVSKTEGELAAIPNFGRKSIEEVKETLATHGLNLRGEE